MAQLQYSNKEIVFKNAPNLLKGNIRKTKYVINTIAKKHKKQIALIEINFTSDKELLKINKDSLNHNFYTDIITFDYCTEKTLEGDIYISTDRVKDNAKQLGERNLDELLRVIFHGILHLVGYKDKTKKEATEMRMLENKYILFFYKTKIVPRGT